MAWNHKYAISKLKYTYKNHWNGGTLNAVNKFFSKYEKKPHIGIQHFKKKKSVTGNNICPQVKKKTSITFNK